MVIKTFGRFFISAFLAWLIFHGAVIAFIFMTQDDPYFRSLPEEIFSIALSSVFAAMITTIVGLPAIYYLKKVKKDGFWPYFRFSLYITFVISLYFYNAFRQIPIDAPPPQFFDNFIWREGFVLFYMRTIFPVAFLTPFIFWRLDNQKETKN